MSIYLSASKARAATADVHLRRSLDVVSLLLARWSHAHDAVLQCEAKLDLLSHHFLVVHALDDLRKHLQKRTCE